MNPYKLSAMPSLHRRAFLQGAVICAAATTTAIAPAWDHTYPNKPMLVLVGAGACGPSD